MIKFDDKVLKLFKGFCTIYDADISECSECYGMMYFNVNNVSYKWRNFYTGVNNDVNPCDIVPHPVITNQHPTLLSWINTHATYINDEIKNRLYFINNVMYYYDNNIDCHPIDIKELSAEDYFNFQFIMNDNQLITFQLGYLIHKEFRRNFFLTATTVQKCIEEHFSGY